MGRAPCCDKANVKKGPWSPEEDATLKNYVESHGTGGNWIALPQKAGLKRCGKSCRLRWLNYLRPDIKHGGFTEEEDNIICTLYSQMGSRWSLIASQLPGRTDNDVKNYWNTKLKKKILAGKSTFNISNTNIIIPTQPAASSAAVLQPWLAKTEPYNLDYSTPQPHIPASLPILSDVGYGFSLSTSQNLGLEHAMHFAHSKAVTTLENNNTNSHNIVTSNSQEGSSVSDSTSLAMESKSVGSMAGNGSSYADDDSGCNILMDQFSYDQFPYEFVNDIWSQEKAAAGGVVPSYYDSTLADFSLADIKPQGVVNNQSVTNQY